MWGWVEIHLDSWASNYNIDDMRESLIEHLDHALMGYNLMYKDTSVFESPLGANLTFSFILGTDSNSSAMFQLAKDCILQQVKQTFKEKDIWKFHGGYELDFNRLALVID